jgi:hypothetical protein
VDDSYNTDDTIFEDVETEIRLRGRDKSMDSKRSSETAKDSGKGNVIVSVRVRPDSGAGEQNSEDGEWMVDGRRSLISYRGKEGGDHIYGMFTDCQLHRQPANFGQTTYSHLTMATHVFMIMQRSDLSAGSWRATMAQCLHTA